MVYNSPVVDDSMVQVKFQVLYQILSSLGGFFGLIRGMLGFAFGLIFYGLFLNDLAIEILKNKTNVPDRGENYGKIRDFDQI